MFHGASFTLKYGLNQWCQWH